MPQPQLLDIQGELPNGPIVLGLGIFDGFHLGHQALAKRCTALMTLYPHPATVLGYETVQHLTTLPELSSLYPHVLSLSFNKQIASISKEDFLHSLISHVQPEKIVVGYDYHFGQNRSGDTDFLRNYCEQKGIVVEVVEPVQTGETPYKSSRIRQMIKTGNFNESIEWLGHDYPLFGTVIHGEGRGASLGFPTANLRLPSDKLCPGPGVYVGAVSAENLSNRPAMIYIGHKPTFHEAGQLTKPEVEVFIPNYSGSLYDQPLNVTLSRFCRGEKKFPSKDALIKQIQRDMEALS